jgi:hypothetical protein
MVEYNARRTLEPDLELCEIAARIPECQALREKTEFHQTKVEFHQAQTRPTTVLAIYRVERIVTANDFRALALRFPEAVEGSHMGHADFRVKGKIFATLGPDEVWGMVKLTPEQQASLMATEPQVFGPAAGAWGRRGSTIVQLAGAEALTVGQALMAAWRNTAPKKLVEQIDKERVEIMRNSNDREKPQKTQKRKDTKTTTSKNENLRKGNR